MIQKRKVDFGFGCMRLPTLQADVPDSFDYDKIEQLFDAFLAKGFTYFDTAYTYHGYHAEEAVRKALVERHLRESFQLVTKMPLLDFKDAEDLERIFNEQLAHCGVGYFDYMPVVTFLEQYSWGGKKVIPFVTSGGSGFGRSLEDLKKYAPGAEILPGGEFLGHEVERSELGISQWAKNTVKDL